MRTHNNMRLSGTGIYEDDYGDASSAETGAHGSNEGIPWGMTGAPKGPVPFTVEIGGQKFEGVIMPPPRVRRDYEQVAGEVAQKLRNEPSLDHSKIEVTLKRRKTWTHYETYFWYVVAKKTLELDKDNL